MNCVYSDKKYCRGEARIYITQAIGNSITAAIDIGIRRISFPTKTETDAVSSKRNPRHHFCVHAVRFTHALAGRAKIYSCFNELSCSFEASIYRLNFSTGLHIIITAVKAMLIVS